jgi:hypothetical protein
MQRLKEQKLVTALPRLVGGERAGSAGLVYLLDAAGQRRIDAECGNNRRVRRPWAVGWPFVQHTLDIAETYVRLRERQAVGDLKLLHFQTEPETWFSTTVGTLKPDARVVFATADWEEHYWLEVDRGTESLPTLSRKLRAYVDFAVSGNRGPSGLVPTVLLTVPSAQRCTAASAVVASLPEPADQLIRVVEFDLVFRGAARPPPI